MRKRKGRMTLALLLTAAMVLTMTPALAFAAGDSGGQVNRISGGNRYDTAAQTALGAYPNGAAAVIIARGDNEGQFADGLAASYLSAVKEAPILLTSPGSLPQETEDAVKKLKPDTAYILGGELAVSAAVAGKLKSLGLKVERLQGANRYATAAMIAAQGGKTDTALVVSGSAPADSLVAGPLASSEKRPILLVSKDSVPGETKQAIAGLNIKTIDVVGGETVVSKAVYEKLGASARYAGHDRIETSLEVAKNLFPAPQAFSIVGYLNLADAVGAAAYGDPIIYVKNSLAEVQPYLAGAATSSARFNIFGGPLAVNSAVADALQKLKLLGEIFTVVLDAGHGGTDPGAVSSVATGSLTEADLNEQQTRILGELLQGYGVNVVYTRDIIPERDNSISEGQDLQNRVDVANNLNADLFLSIHHNSFDGQSAHGVETYYCSSKLVAETVEPSILLAKNIVDSIAELGFYNRGHKDNIFMVTKYTTMPSVLIEAGFMSNDAEVLKVADKKMQLAIAQAIADTIIDFYNL